MARINTQDSHFTRDVRKLVNRLNDRTLEKDSVLDRAIEFFKQDFQDNLNGYAQEITALKTQVADSKMSKKGELKAEIEKIEASQQVYRYQLKSEAQIRHQHFQEVCLQLIDMCEGENFEDALRKSAQLLGTIQLISPTEGSQIAATNERHKGIYKAVLCLRLLDELIISKQLNDPFVNLYVADFTGKRYRLFQKADPEAYKLFVEQVKLAVVMSALLQDIGSYHPDAQEVLLGPRGALDPYRTLEVDERKQLLQISFRETNRYLIDGLNTLTYVGNSREEKNLFEEREKEKQLFIRRLLKGAIKPQKGIGNLLKVPQIYTSIVLSTKPSYNYKVIPKVYSVLNLNADRGACEQTVVNSLYKITGMFPQGYGVTYVPKTVDGIDLDYYEYAVVCQFYPENPEEPICRQATRNLSYISYGQDIVIVKTSNLYFPEIAKRFSRVSKKRLLEILETLASNFEERKDNDILPRCWFPNDYFSIKNNQNLWNKAVQ